MSSLGSKQLDEGGTRLPLVAPNRPERPMPTSPLLAVHRKWVRLAAISESAPLRTRRVLGLEFIQNSAFSAPGLQSEAQP
jgi:hypothetical protein